MEVVRVDKQPFMVATDSADAMYYDQEFGPIKFTSRRKYKIPRKAYMDSKGSVEIRKEASKLLKVTTIVPYRPIATIVIFKMKVQQTMERIEEEHLQNTCGAEIIFEENA